jgi:hypothetical protein
MDWEFESAGRRSKEFYVGLRDECHEIEKIHEAKWLA